MKTYKLNINGLNIEVTQDTDGKFIRPDILTNENGKNSNLKPAYEPIIMARKPLDGTVVNNVLKHGVGGLNIDACRVGSEGATCKGSKPKGESKGIYGEGLNGSCNITKLEKGRYPANIILDGSDSVEALFPYTKCGDNKIGHKNGGTFGTGKSILYNQKGSEGSASRYFYHAKASKKDRDEGLEGTNTHNTVKPTQLMRYLVRLVTPHGGLVLDPFMGSGSTGKACMLEGMRFIGMELSEEYVKIADARVKHAQQQRGLLNG
jgi:site-specific DNA-methyltransferase (adenine-specific)